MTAYSDPGENGRADPLTRRAFLVAAGTTAAAAGLAACGGSAKQSPTLASAASVHTRGRTQAFLSEPHLRPPEVIIAHRQSNPPSDLILTDAHAGPGQQGPIIFDPHGRLVWFGPVSAGPTPAMRAMNVRVQSYRGKPVLTWWQGAVVADHGVGHYELVDGRYQRVAQVHAGNGYRGDLHEFVLTDSGTALFTCYGSSEAELPHPSGSRRGRYVYGVAQEVDVATGRVLFEWRTDEHVGFIDSYHAAPDDPTIPWDYFHINSIAIDPADGHLLISGRNTWSIYKVHRQTGEVLWTLGGKRGDFEIGPGARFAFQHHVRPHDGGIVTIFDNEAGPPREARQSRGLVLAVDERAFTAKLVTQYKHKPPIVSPALGSVQDLGDSDGGGRFIGWGDSSYFTHYSSSGSVLLDGRLASGAISYRAFMQPWTGVPVTRPEIALVRASPHVHLYASWNGATEHQSWRVLGGSQPDRLNEIGTAAVADFETQIMVPHAPPWLAAEALDSSGNALSRSAPMRV